jgi:hypothetical protein
MADGVADGVKPGALDAAGDSFAGEGVLSPRTLESETATEWGPVGDKRRRSALGFGVAAVSQHERYIGG